MPKTVSRVLLFILAGFLTVSCASLRGGDKAGLSVNAEGSKALRESPPPGDLNDSGADLEAVPLAINQKVLQWIDYFQGAGRPHMERYLSRSTRYAPIMKSILRKEGLPEDLIYIALIESGFSSTAHSHANAVGYWQFIRGTGRRYGLEINSYVDERRDFVRSTQAAAAYFKDLYGMFHSWYLAIASYNVGEGRVKKLVTRYRTHDFWQLARENKLPEETINYVPKFIAARLIAKAPEKYGFTDIEYMPPLEFAEVEFETSMDLRKLAKEMGLEYDDLRDLNPAYKRGVAFYRGKEKLVIRVPKGTEAVAVAAAVNATPDSKVVYRADEDYTYYRVRRGDTISGIAKKFRTSQKTILQLNGLKSSSILSIGQRLRVPAENFDLIHESPQTSKRRAVSGGSVAGLKDKRRQIASEIQRSNSNQEKRARARRVHVVQKGDTLYDIARKYQIPLTELTKHNNIRRSSKLTVGTVLEIP